MADLCAHLAVINHGRLLLTGKPDALIGQLRGRIWRKTVGKTEIAELGARLPLVSTRLQSGRTVVRAYSEGRPPEAGFEPVEAELEDVYFCSIAGYVQQAGSEAAAA